MIILGLIIVDGNDDDDDDGNGHLGTRLDHQPQGSVIDVWTIRQVQVLQIKVLIIVRQVQVLHEKSWKSCMHDLG